jgi:hypothetical protein
MAGVMKLMHSPAPFQRTPTGCGHEVAEMASAGAGQVPGHCRRCDPSSEVNSPGCTCTPSATRGRLPVAPSGEPTTRPRYTSHPVYERQHCYLDSQLSSLLPAIGAGTGVTQCEDLCAVLALRARCLHRHTPDYHQRVVRAPSGLHGRSW